MTALAAITSALKCHWCGTNFYGFGTPRAYFRVIKTDPRRFKAGTVFCPLCASTFNLKHKSQRIELT